MHSLPKLSTQLFELCSLLLAYRLSKYRKLSLTGFSANMGETYEFTIQNLTPLSRVANPVAKPTQVDLKIADIRVEGVFCRHTCSHL